MVLGEGHSVEVHNCSDDVPVQIIQDGHTMGEVRPGGRVSVAMGDQRAKLARLSGTSFLSRYRETFGT